eukprot:TRINITY_DN1610_c0_g2_i1.p1 TRINITY_DN1610_c0_g2~~TRINITY_DN1610_c0_g2_i1.p1  ORF type:complete len:442 (-),score=90.04 TRINITY_DN1610_c0_g2_i1:751-2076(-)
MAMANSLQFGQVLQLGVFPHSDVGCVFLPKKLATSSFSESLQRKQIPSKSFGLSNRRRVRSVTCRAEKEDGAGVGPVKMAPLAPESAVGQFLTQILQSHPHLFSAAAEQQLEQLATDRATDEEKSNPSDTDKSSSSTDIVLYKRIADIRQSERRRAIEEVMYALIVQRFIDAGAPLVPHVPFITEEMLSTVSNPSQLPTVGPSKDRELERIHSEEALEMVRDHLTMVFGGKSSQSPLMDDRVLVATSKLRMGQVYASSIMYGYFLRRVDQRFQLEKSMRLLTEGFIPLESFQEGQAEETVVMNAGGTPNWGKGESDLKFSAPVFNTPSSDGREEGSLEAQQQKQELSKLRSYVMSFDADTLRKTAAMQSREGVNVVEKQTQALFGRPEVVLSQEEGLAIVKEENVRVSISTLRRMILEAIAFGSFLWDVECYVDSHYKIAP